MITRPGIYLDIAAADYHADPCPAPSFTQSIGKILLAKSPLHAWHAHPRLNPDYQHDDDTKFDIGNIAHKTLLGRGKEIVILDFDDWRTKAAKEAREEASATGKLAVLGKHAARADAMVRAAREQLDLRDLTHIFNPDVGNSEVVMVWQQGPIWLRQMLDWLSSENLTYRTMADFKTTAESAAPDALARKMVSDGWHIQAAMAERGLDALDPQTGGRRQYLFVVQEDTKPYALSVVEIGEGPLTLGRKLVDQAADIWAACMKAGRWPGYPLDINIPQIPGWYETHVLEREVAHEEWRKHPAYQETVRKIREARKPQPDDLIMGG